MGEKREFPVMMDGESVRAILDGTMTVDCRPVRLPKPRFGGWMHVESTRVPGLGLVHQVEERGEGGHRPMRWTEDRGALSLPAPGDRLWVREAWAAGACADSLSPTCLSPRFWRADNGGLWFRADDAKPANAVTPRGRWRPSIHMPRWASRLVLEVVSVWVERVRSVCAFDIIRMGYPEWSKLPDSAVFTRFREEWDARYAGRGAGWDANPWVRLTFFRRPSPALSVSPTLEAGGDHG